MCNKEPKLPHTHNLHSGLAVTIYVQDLLLTICARVHNLHSQSTLRFSSHEHRSRFTTHDLCSRLTTHDLRSVTIYAQDLPLTIYALDLRSWSGAHDLTLTIYADGLRSRSMLTVCQIMSECRLVVIALTRARSRATSWRPIPTNLRTIYAIKVVLCFNCVSAAPSQAV